MRQNPHVRICGGPGSATTLVYPTGKSRTDHEQACRAAPTRGGPNAAWRGSSTWFEEFR